MPSHLRLKTRLFVAVVVLSSMLGNFFLTWGVRQMGKLLTFSPMVYLRAMLNPWVVLGVALLLVWLLAHTLILSWADLSYVLPVTSIGYVLTALMGKIFLHEEISVGHWTGILLIVVGVGMVDRTATHGAAE
jgi:uncharacterized membrane protein